MSVGCAHTDTHAQTVSGQWYSSTVHTAMARRAIDIALSFVRFQHHVQRFGCDGGGSFLGFFRCFGLVFALVHRVQWMDIMQIQIAYTFVLYQTTQFHWFRCCRTSSVA